MMGYGVSRHQHLKESTNGYINTLAHPALRRYGRRIFCGM